MKRVKKRSKTFNVYSVKKVGFTQGIREVLGVPEAKRHRRNGSFSKGVSRAKAPRHRRFGLRQIASWALAFLFSALVIAAVLVAL